MWSKGCSFMQLRLLSERKQDSCMPEEWLLVWKNPKMYTTQKVLLLIPLSMNLDTNTFWTNYIVHAWILSNLLSPILKTLELCHIYSSLHDVSAENFKYFYHWSIEFWIIILPILCDEMLFSRQPLEWHIADTIVIIQTHLSQLWWQQVANLQRALSCTSSSAQP